MWIEKFSFRHDIWQLRICLESHGQEWCCVWTLVMHLVNPRAKREEEIPFLEEAYKKRLEEDKQLHEEQQVAFLAAHRAAWEVDIVEKNRLSAMADERAVFQVLRIGR